MNRIEISECSVIPIKPINGLCGFAHCVINNQFYVGSIAIYSSPSSKDGFRLVFPAKKLASGKIVEIFHPINKVAEQAVTSVIIKRYLELMDNFHHVDGV